MAGQIGGQDDEPIAAINVVPLVDIILVVLIIFMVTAPLVLKPAIDINLPKSSSGEDTPATPVNIAISSNGTLSLNGQASTLEQISAFAANVIATKPDTAAILQPDRSVTIDQLTALIDAVKTAGIKKVAFSVEKKATGANPFNAGGANRPSQPTENAPGQPVRPGQSGDAPTKLPQKIPSR